MGSDRHWYLVLAKRLPILSNMLEDALTDKRFLQFYTEWTESERLVDALVAFLDAAFRYNASEEIPLDADPARGNAQRLHHLQA